MGDAIADFVERDWLKEELDDWFQSPTSTLVLVAEPGFGKTTFLKHYVAQKEGSVYVELRPVAGNCDPLGFWNEVLAQVELGGEKPAREIWEAVRRCAQALPGSADENRLVVIDGLEQFPEIIDFQGWLEFQRVKIIFSLRPFVGVDSLVHAGAALAWHNSTEPSSMADVREFLRGKEREELADFCLGNFMIARLAHDQQRLGLSLHNLWRQVLKGVPQEIRRETILVASVLAECPPALSLDTLADFTGLDTDTVSRAVDCLVQLFHLRGDQVAFFHPAMDKVISRLTQRDLMQIHGRVIAFFRETFPSWEEMADPYGWHFLGYHCDRFARVGRRQDFSLLHWLVEGPYLHSKLSQTGSVPVTLRDLERGFEASLVDFDLPRVVAYGLRMAQMCAAGTPRCLHFTADIGNLETAVENARFINPESSRLLALLLLAWQAETSDAHQFSNSLLDEAATLPPLDLSEAEIAVMGAVVLGLWKREDCREKVEHLLENVFMNRSRGAVLALCGFDAEVSKKEAIAFLERSVEALANFDPPGDRSVWRWRAAFKLLRLGVEPDYKFPREPISPELFKRSKTPKEAFPRVMESVMERRSDDARANGITELCWALTKAKGKWVMDAVREITEQFAKISGWDEKFRAFRGLMIALPELNVDLDELSDEVSELLQGWEQVEWRALGWGEFGVALHRSGRPQQSRETFSKAASLAFSLDAARSRAVVLKHVAGAVARTGHASRARDLAFHGLEAQGESRVREPHHSILAIRAGLTQQRELEMEDFRPDLDVVDAQKDPRVKAMSLASLADGFRRLGNQQWGDNLLNQAIAITRAMDEGKSKAVTLSQLALSFKDDPKSKRALQLLTEADDTLGRAALLADKAEGWIALAGAFDKLGRMKKAREFLGKAMKALEEMPAVEMTESEALTRAVELSPVYNLGDEIQRLVARADEGIEKLPIHVKDLRHWNLCRVELALNDFTAAIRRVPKILGLEVRCRASVDVVRAGIREFPNDAIHLIYAIPLHDYRMVAVQRALLENSLEMRPTYQTQMRSTLARLTMIAMHDYETADLAISRWIHLETKPYALKQVCAKMGWSHEVSGADNERVASGYVEQPADEEVEEQPEDSGEGGDFQALELSQA